MSVRLWGQQTLVNVSTTGTQAWPVIETLSNGNLIVAWYDSGRGGGDIYGRLFSPDGKAASGELALATSAAREEHPSIAALPGGLFEMVFESDTNVSFVRYNASGVSQIAGITGSRELPAVAGNAADTGFSAVSTQGFNLYLSRFSAAHADLGQQTVTTTMLSGGHGDIARLSTGGMAIAWAAPGPLVYARTVAPNGVLAPAPIQLSAMTAALTSTPKVTALQDGAFLVTWHGFSSAYPSSSEDIFGRIVTGAGAPVGAEAFLINSRTAGVQLISEPVALKDGGFMVFWADSGSFIRGQVFNALGERVGGDIIVNPNGNVYGVDGGLEATLLPDGRVAVVWNGATSGDNDGTYMQIVDPRAGYVEGSSAADTLYGHDVFEDLMIGAAGSDTMYGMGGTDAIYAGEGADTADGGFGDDMIDGGPDADLLRGDLGNDLIYGDRGDDVVAGGAGNDLIFGGLNNDWLEGGADNDTMLGEAGGDRLEGQDGNDVLDGGIGDDVVIGGAGNDIVYVDSLGDQVIEAAGGGTDIVYSSVNWLGNANVENLVLTGNAPLNATMNNDANLVAGNGAANVINGAGGNDIIDGLGGNDWLGGGDGGDRLDGGADNDTIQGGVGADALYGGAGADSFYYGSYLDSNATQGIDSIQDFQVGVDKINLTPARLSLTDSATIVYAYGNAYVFVDLYGDGINDMIIEVIGATTLSGADLNFAPPAAAAIYYGDDETALTEAQQAAHHRASWDAVF